MKECYSCKIKINTSSKRCPLCNNPLDGECKELLFPSNTKFKNSSILLKILLFLSICVFSVFSFFEHYFTNEFNYSFYVGLGFITNYITIYHILKNYQNIYKMFCKYGIILILLMIAWYFFTKKTIIVNYIIPAISIFEILFSFIVGIIFRGKYLFKYSGLLFVNLLLLLFPVIFVITGITTNNLMSYICVLICFLTIAGLIIFIPREIKEEIIKLLNI